MNMKVQAIGSALAISFFSTASATVLTFDGTAVGRSLTEYGDRVTNFGASGDSLVYGSAGGITPNIVVDYQPGSGFAPFTIWGSGYGDLTSALGHQSYDVPGEVVLTPDAGFHVTLNSFDIGAWVSDYPDSRVRVLDAAGTVRFDTGVFKALHIGNGQNGTNAGHYSFPFSPITSSLALRIEVTEFGDLGLDNIQFSQSAVPLPTAIWLLGSALAGIGFARRRPT